MLFNARAKVNLTLEITGRRDDGMHMLDTVFQPLSLSDRVFVERRSSGLAFSCTDRALETPDNLVCRAFRLMQARFGLEEGLDIRLEKHIPYQAGMGGGSSDAAAVLKACNELFDLQLSRKQLAALGAELGADVPALLYDGATRGSGTGTEVRPIETALSLPLLIIKPKAGLSTPLMYRKLDELGESISLWEGRSEKAEAALRAGDAEGLKAQLFNAFDAAAGGDEIDLSRRMLADAGAEKTVLCGSGSASFGVFSDGKSRDAAADSLRAKLPGGWQLLSADTVNEESAE